MLKKHKPFFKIISRFHIVLIRANNFDMNIPSNKIKKEWR